MILFSLLTLISTQVSCTGKKKQISDNSGGCKICLYVTLQKYNYKMFARKPKYLLLNMRRHESIREMDFPSVINKFCQGVFFWGDPMPEKISTNHIHFSFIYFNL